MENKVDNVDFVNSINRILWEFTTKDYDDILYDVHVCFDYNEVKKTFNNIENDNLDLKPVIHYSLQPIENSARTIVSQGIQGERNFLEYFVYVVIDYNYKSHIPRYMLLNQISGKLKHKFDNYKKELDEFHIVKLTPNEGVLGENADGLIATQHELTFRVDREI